MKRKNNSSPVTSVNLEQSEEKISFNYYYTIVVLVVVMINLVLMLYCNPF